MKTDYTIYRHDGTTEHGSVDWPSHPSYQVMAASSSPSSASPWSTSPSCTTANVATCSSTRTAASAPTPSRLTKRHPLIYKNLTLSRGLSAHSVPDIIGDAILFHRLVWF